MTDANVIDIRRLLEDRSLVLSEEYSRALLSIALAFAEYAGIDGRRARPAYRHSQERGRRRTWALSPSSTRSGTTG
jgi:hypothetical protein